MFENISKFLDKYIPVKFVVTDAIEIIILAIAFYEIMIWIRKTKAWILLKGIVAIIAFMLIASIFNLDTIPFSHTIAILKVLVLALYKK